MMSVESASVPSQSKTMSLNRRCEAITHRWPRSSSATNAARSRGSGASNAMRLAGQRMHERDLVRVQEHALQSLLRPAACSTRSRRTCRRPPTESRDASGARGSGACARSSSASSRASGGSWSSHIALPTKYRLRLLARLIVHPHPALAFLRRELVQRKPHAALLVAPAATDQDQIALVETRLRAAARCNPTSAGVSWRSA